MSVSVAQILDSPQFRDALDRLRDGYTQKVMSRSTAPEVREQLLMKFHLLDELEVDLSQHRED